MWVNHQRTLQAFLVAPILKRQAHKSLSFFGVTAAKVQSLRLHSIGHEPCHQRAPDCSRAPSPLSPCLQTHFSEELVVYTVEGETKNFQFQTNFGFYCCCDKIVSTKVTERLIWLIVPNYSPSSQSGRSLSELITFYPPRELTLAGAGSLPLLIHSQGSSEQGMAPPQLNWSSRIN